MENEQQGRSMDDQGRSMGDAGRSMDDDGGDEPDQGFQRMMDADEEEDQTRKTEEEKFVAAYEKEQEEDLEIAVEAEADILAILQKTSSSTDRCLMECCGWPRLISFLEYMKLLIPGILRNFDQITDIAVVFAVGGREEKLISISTCLLCVTVLSIGFRWYISLRLIHTSSETETLGQLPMWKKVALLIYVVPIFGIPLYFIYDVSELFWTSTLPQADDPEYVLNKTEFHSFIELVVESLPASVMGIVIFMNNVNDLDLNKFGDQGTLFLIVFSTCLSIYNVYKTYKTMEKQSRFHQMAMLDYVYYRVQFSDCDLKAMMPFIGGLTSGTAEHVNYAAHKFREAEVEKIDKAIAPFKGMQATAPKLKSFQLSPFSLCNLTTEEAYRLGQVLHRRHKKDPLDIFCVKVCEIKDFQDCWKALDYDGSNLVEKQEFVERHSLDVFEQLSEGRNVIFKGQLFEAVMFNTTGYVEECHLRPEDWLRYAITQRHENFLAFCLSCEKHFETKKNVERPILYKIPIPSLLGRENDKEIDNAVFEKGRDIIAYILKYCEIYDEDSHVLLEVCKHFDKNMLFRALNFYLTEKDEVGVNMLTENKNRLLNIWYQGEKDSKVHRMFYALEAKWQDVDFVKNSAYFLSILYDLPSEDWPALQARLRNDISAIQADDYVLILNTLIATGQHCHQLFRRFRKISLETTNHDLLDALCKVWTPEEVFREDKLEHPENTAMRQRHTELAKRQLGVNSSSNEDKFTASKRKEFEKEMKKLRLKDNWVELLKRDKLGFDVQETEIINALPSDAKRVKILHVFLHYAPNFLLRLVERENKRREIPVEVLSSLMKQGDGAKVLKKLVGHRLVNCLEQAKKHEAEVLFRAGGQVAMTDEMGNPVNPMFLAVSGGFDEIVDNLLEQDTDSNIKDRQEGNTPLILAARGGKTKIAQALIKHGSELNIKNFNGDTALIQAVHGSYSEIVDELLNMDDVDTNVANKRGLTALMIAQRDMKRLKRDEHGDLIRIEDPETGQMLTVSENVDYDYTKRLLERNADPNAQEGQEKKGMTALMRACKTPQLLKRNIQTLLKNQADPNIKTQDKNTALLIAAEKKGGLAAVEALVSSGADLNVQHRNTKDTPLLRAQKAGLNKIVDKLLEGNGDLNLFDKNGETILILAAKDSNEQLVVKLLDLGAKINQANNSGFTALTWAVANNSTKIIKLLLDRGASPNVKDDFGRTPLMMITQRGVPDIVELLLEKGAEIEPVNSNGETALYFAVGTDTSTERIVKMFLAQGADVNKATRTGDTPLLLATKRGSVPIVQALLDQGAIIDHTNNGGWSAVMLAVQGGDKDLVNVFVSRKAKLDLKLKAGEMTALHLAVVLGKDNLVQTLVQCGADTTIQNSIGQTPKDVAKKNGQKWIANFLEQHEQESNL